MMAQLFLLCFPLLKADRENLALSVQRERRRDGLTLGPRTIRKTVVTARLGTTSPHSPRFVSAPQTDA